jgi:hypothetical protein
MDSADRTPVRARVKNNANYGIADELMSENFVRHLPYQGLPPGCGP